MEGNYLHFFGLSDYPFRLTPDTKYFFPSSRHKTVLEVIKYGLNRGDGFIIVTGDPGAGKTMLLRVLMKELDPSFETALIIAPTLEPKELLQAILEDLGVEFSSSDTKERLIKKFREHLIEMVSKGKKLLLIIDEAQNLPLSSIEEIRLLSNLETEERKLIQILLVGQPTLEEKLKSPELSQFIQRISIWERIAHLSRDETIWYVQHRLGCAGGAHIPIEKPAEKLLYKVTQGIPRLINKVMDRTMLVTATKLQRRITKGIMKEAIESLGPTLVDTAPSRNSRRWWSSKPMWVLLIVTMLMLAGFCTWFLLKKKL
ncbi:MAG: AAA family ATPase [Syntrophobacterales bacterium]|nr:AAA family ATPase [Syntrophobacterales bacterium]